MSGVTQYTRIALAQEQVHQFALCMLRDTLLWIAALLVYPTCLSPDGCSTSWTSFDYVL